MDSQSPAKKHSTLWYVQLWAVCLLVVLVMVVKAQTLGATSFRGIDDLAAMVEAQQENHHFRNLPVTMRHYFRVMLSENDDDFGIGRKRLTRYLIDDRYDSAFVRWYVETKLKLFVSVEDQVDLLANVVTSKEGRNLWEISEKRFSSPVQRLDSLQFLEAAALMYFENVDTDQEALGTLIRDFAYRLRNHNMWPIPESWTNEKFPT